MTWKIFPSSCRGSIALSRGCERPSCRFPLAHAGARTPTLHRTCVAARSHGAASGLAQSHQQSIELYPVPPRQRIAKCALGLVGVTRADVAPAVRDAVHVGVDTNTGKAVRHRHDQIRRLATDPRKPQQRIDVVGNSPGELALEYATDLDQPLGFGAIEADRIDRISNRHQRRCRQRARVRRNHEQARRRAGRHSVLRAQAQDACRQHPVRVVLGLRYERGNRRLDGTAEIANRSHHAGEVSIVDVSPRGSLHRLPVGAGGQQFKRRSSRRGRVDDPGSAPVWCAAMRLRTGLVGLGKHGLRYAKHIHDDVPGLQLAAICRRDRRAGEELARSYGCDYVAEASILAERDDIDLIVVVAPPAVVERVVPLAAARKKRLLVEKPVAADLHIGLRILAEIERNGVYCAAGQTLRMNTVVREIERRVEDLGRLDSMIFSQRFPPQLELTWLDDPPQSGGGNVLHTGVHCFDLCRVLSGVEPEAAFCTTRSVHTRRTEDVFASCIDMSDGSLATVNCSRTTRSRNGLIEVTGELGQLVGDHVLNTLYHLGPDGREDIALSAPTHTVLELLRTVADDCQRDRAPTISYREGLAAVAVADACYRSVASGRKERIVMPPSGP